MAEFSDTQKEIMEKLYELKIPKEDIFSVMLVLTKEEKAKEFLDAIKNKTVFTSDEICETAGRIAFGNENGDEN